MVSPLVVTTPKSTLHCGLYPSSNATVFTSPLQEAEHRDTVMEKSKKWDLPPSTYILSCSWQWSSLGIGIGAEDLWWWWTYRLGQVVDIGFLLKTKEEWSKHLQDEWLPLINWWDALRSVLYLIFHPRLNPDSSVRKMISTEELLVSMVPGDIVPQKSPICSVPAWIW